MVKHYIRLDLNNNIIKGYSSDFEEVQQGDICISEDGGRQFELNGDINPSLVNKKSVCLFKYINGEVIQRTDEEIETDELNLPKPELSLEEKLNLLQKAMDDLLLGGGL